MEPFIGQIQLYPYSFAPKGWTLCDGRLLQIKDNQSLFSLLGTNYGGDGTTTFGLPDLRNAALDSNQQGIGSRYYIALWGEFPSKN